MIPWDENPRWLNAPMKRFISCVLVGIALVGSIAAQSTNTVLRDTNPNVAGQAPALPCLEWQWRPGLDRSLFPALLVYLHNPSDSPIEWGKVFLNEKEAGLRTNGVAYLQYYPAAVAQPHETVELQLGFSEIPTTSQTLVIKTKDGRQLTAVVGPYFVPTSRITGVAFAVDYRQLFLTFVAPTAEPVPLFVAVNGTDCTTAMRIWESSTTKRPGLISVALPQPTAQGRPVYIRLQFMSQPAHAIVRAYRGISLDCYDIGTLPTNQALRAELGLDSAPAFTLLHCDPTCNDVSKDGFPGKSMPQILAERQALYAATPDRLSALYLCTTAANGSYSMYSYCTDLTFCSPYSLNWMQTNRFIDEEEYHLRWTADAAAPHPWGWIPEAFCNAFSKRSLEPPELRLEVLAALGFGVKGIDYHLYHHPDLTGFEQMPSLLAEIKQVNADLRKLMPFFAAALPLSTVTVGGRTNGVCVSTLWSGDIESLVIVTLVGGG